jgi:hypothetical protein
VDSWTRKNGIPQAKQAAEKMTRSVIPSEAKKPLILSIKQQTREILRLAQNDSVLCFSAACEARATK